MDHLDDILKLLDALAGLPFENIEVSTPDVTVRVGRGSAGAGAVPQGARAERRPAAPLAEKPEEQSQKTVVVASPIIGVFYASPSPEEAPFVNVGDEVRAGQTLCIVEAMKLMNEIPSPVTGTVLEMQANDGSEVEVGQALFLVEVAEG